MIHRHQLLTPEEIHRIELKWECIRLSSDYQKDYTRQEETLTTATNDERKQVENDFYEKWLMRRLPNWDHSASWYRKKFKISEYKKWLNKFRGLVRLDPLANHEVRENFMSSLGLIMGLGRSKKNVLAGKIVELKGGAYSRRNKIDKRFEVSFSIYADQEKLVESFRELIKRIKTMLLRRGIDSLDEPELRDSNIEQYLAEYKKRLRGEKIYSREGLGTAKERRRRRDLAKGKKLVEQRYWRLI